MYLNVFPTQYYPFEPINNTFQLSQNMPTETMGAVTRTKVNAISHGKLSLGASHLGFSKPC